MVWLGVNAEDCGQKVYSIGFAVNLVLVEWMEVFVGGDKVIGAVVRFIVSALVIWLVSFIIPGFTIAGFVNALIAAIVIAALGWLVELVMGGRISPQNRGIVGFITAAVVIFAAQFVVPTMTVTVLGALLASLVIGLVDAFVPTELR